MRWATFKERNSRNAADRVGVVDGDRIYALPEGARLIELLGDDGTRLREAGARARKAPAAVFALEQVQLRPPIPNPPSIRDFSSFYEHIAAGLRAIGLQFDDSWFELPIFYFSNPNALVAHDEAVRIPANTQQMDYELEVCAIIGREGIDIDPAEAESYIAGYSIFNDWSARDVQRDEMKRCPIGPAKGKDSANGLGPYLVTPDELADRRKDNGFDLTMTAAVNGREYSRGNWSTLYWSFAQMIAYASRNTRLVPGDIIGAGTVGTGCILEQSATHGSEKYPYLKEGDEVVLEIERLGRLRNRIVVGAPPKPLK